MDLQNDEEHSVTLLYHFWFLWRHKNVGDERRSGKENLSKRYGESLIFMTSQESKVVQKCYRLGFVLQNSGIKLFLLKYKLII